ncbi:MAG: DUF1285 domain-containing protein [Sphingopyxis sp.]
MPAPVPEFSNSPLARILAWIDADAPPPVDQWHPAHSGQIDIRIATDGTWFHEGGAMTRPAMVRLFSRILRAEDDGSIVLVTPAEKLTIQVDDAPFVAVEMRETADELLFRLNSGDVVAAGAGHPIILRDGPAGRLPYLRARGTADRPLWARLARPVYYELAQLADADGCVACAGQRFTIGDVE